MYENDGENGIGWNESPKYPDTLSFKGQTPKNWAGKRKGAKETEEPGSEKGCTAVHPTTTVHVHHHGQTMVVSGSAVPPFPERCILVLLFGP